MSNDVEDIALRSEEIQEILMRLPNWMVRWGGLIFLLLLLLLAVITWFVKYPDVITAEAMITTQIPPEKEYARTTGKLDTVLVKDNQVVESGQPLAIIENTANFKDVFLLKSIVDTIEINYRDFNFPIDSLPVLFLGEIDPEYIMFESNYLQYKLNRQLQPFLNEANANRFSIKELNRRLDNLQAQKELFAKEIEYNNKRIERNKILFEKGVISAFQYENEQLEYLQAERNFKEVNNTISAIRETISNANKTFRGTEISRTKEEMILLKNVIQSFVRLKKSIRSWEMLYVFTSGTKGKISFLNYWSESQTVNEGEMVFSVIPVENTSFIAKLKAPIQNSGKIKVGQKVNIKLENYPEVEFGILKGEVKSISLIPDSEGIYHINVVLPRKLITSYKKEIAFKQEMRGIAEIVTEDLRLIERLFYQFKDFFD